MNVVCAWCKAEGMPALIRIVEPVSNTEVSHGICEHHQVEFLAAADRWTELMQPRWGSSASLDPLPAETTDRKTTVLGKRRRRGVGDQGSARY